MKKRMLTFIMAGVTALGLLAGCGSDSGAASAGSSESAAAAETTDAAQTATEATTGTATETAAGTATETAAEAATETAAGTATETAAGTATAAEDLPALPERIKEAGKIVAGVKADFAPFGYVDENGNNAGYDLEIAKKLAEYAFGDPNAVKFEIVTSSNRIPFLTSNKVDLLLASMAITDERLEEINFTNIYMSTGHLILTDAENENVTSIEDLNSKDATILLVAGTTGATAAEAYCPDANFLYYETWSETLSALKAGRGDAIIHDESVLYETAAADSSVKIIGQAFENTWVAGGVRKDDAEWLAWLNAAFEKMQKEDFFYTEFQNWFADWSNVPEGLPRAGMDAITVESKGFTKETVHESGKN